MAIIDDRLSPQRVPALPLVERLARRLSAPFFLAGVAAGFGLCCALGYLTAGSVTYAPFVRFHQLINPESSFQPTVLQVQRMVLDTPASKILVVVGGSSRMNGAGQTVAAIWTGLLQEKLGNRYHVLNLAMRGGTWDQFGMHAVEMALRARRKVIFVADSPGFVLATPFGAMERYRYFFFDAMSHGLLLDYEPRTLAIEHVRSHSDRKDADAIAELVLRGSLDRIMYFSDLWTTVGYDYGFVASWSIPTRNAPFRARRYAEDNTISNPYANSQLPSADTMDALHRVIGYYEDSIARGFHAYDVVPGVVRERTVLVVLSLSPFYTRHLDESDQRRLHDAERRAHALEAQAGMLSAGTDSEWTVDDFDDVSHLSERGGRRLAAIVAPAVRQMAARLGYFW
jgi:hypothetical protein